MACIKSCFDKMVGFSVGGILLLASGCYDEGERLVVMRPDGSPFLCSDNEETRWIFEAPVVVDGERAYVVRDEGKAKKGEKYVAENVLSGSMEAGRVPWVQFSIYCGNSEEAFYVTPKLDLNDFVKKGDSKYIYFIAEEPSKRE